MSFSIVIAAHQAREDLARLLDALDEHLPEAPQVIVADSGSGDGGADLARSRGAEVVELAGNPGFGAANVAGLARARHEVTVLLNPDVLALDDGLARLAAMAAGRRALLAPGLRNADGSRQRSAHPVPGTWRAFVPALLPSAVLPGELRLDAEPWRARTPRPVGWAIAACLAAPTALLRELGPFDPDVFLFAEDLDLCLRARAEGVPTILHPEIVLAHAGATATRAHFGGEPHDLHARRRREVIAARLGPGALRRDDAAQALTFATRILGRRLLGRDARRERAQLAALRRARAADQNSPS